MSEDLVKRLRDHAEAGRAIKVAPGATTISGWRRFADDMTEAADHIEALERELATSRHMHSQAFSAGVGEKLRATTAEQALAAALKRLEMVAEIAVEPYDASARASQAVQYAYLLSRIATIAKEPTNG